MKRFIRYLYEYEQGKRLRNVGFVKVEQKDEDCTLSIHGKGLHMKGERKLDLYLFFDEGDGCAGIWQGTVDNVNPAINYRLFYTVEDVIVPENFQKINGIILESETGRKYAAVWNDTVIDVGRMRVLKPDNEQKETMPAEDALPGEEMPAEQGSPEEERQEDASLQGEGVMGQEEVMQDDDAAAQENAVQGNESMQEETAPKEAQIEPYVKSTEQGQGSLYGRTPAMPEHAMHAGVPVEDTPVEEEPIAPVTEEPAKEDANQENTTRRWPGQVPPEEEHTPAGNRGMFRDSNTDAEFGREMTVEPIGNICGDTREKTPRQHLRCTKIQRNDMARLPRCEWKWANNSFLLHGYYNYHHLAIIDDGERYRLGVPGIYHPQEAKAASTFGFTEFIPHEDTGMDLTDDEKSSQEQFGYWCRPIKRMLKTQ